MLQVVLLCSCALCLPAFAERPQLRPEAIHNAADQSTGRVAPGEIIILHSPNTGPEILAGSQLDPAGRVTTLLGDTRVLFDGVPAPISYSVRGSVGAIVPYEVSGKRETEIILEYQGESSGPVRLPVVASAPALFTLDSSGHGQAAMLNEAGCCNSVRNPAAQGSLAVLYATGAGETAPASITGTVAAYDRVADYPHPRSKVQVFVGGQPAEIVYAGSAPHAVSGLLQVNFRVPPQAPMGDAIPLVLQLGTARSSDQVTMAVRSSRRSILVLDQQPARRRWMTQVLRGAGYNVQAAASDAEAATAHPDLVITTLDDFPRRQATLASRRAANPRLVTLVRIPDASTSRLRAADLLEAQAVLTGSVTARQLLQRTGQLLRSRPQPYEAPPQILGPR